MLCDLYLCKAVQKKNQFSVTLPTWLVAAGLNRADIEYFHHCRKLYWTTVLGIVYQSFKAKLSFSSSAFLPYYLLIQ